MIIGIDPGAKGAMAIIHDNQDLEIVRFSKFLDLDSLEIDDKFVGDLSQSAIYMEKVHSMPWDTPVTAFSFGRNVGYLEAIIKMNYGIINYIQPKTWQKELYLERTQVDKRITNAKTEKAARKKAYVGYAQKMFPKYESLINLETADAVLIAQYGYNRTYEV